MKQDDFRGGWIDGPKFVFETEASQFRDRTSQFNTRRSAADDREGQPGFANDRMFLIFSIFERRKQLRAHRGGIVYPFQTGRKARPIVPSKIAMRAPVARTRKSKC